MATKLTVFLVRHGETELDVGAPNPPPPPPPKEGDDDAEGDNNGEGDEGTPTDSNRNNKLRLHQELDPALTPQGYHQAQQVYTCLIQQICDATPVPADRGDSDSDGVIDPLRNLACFAAPLQACLGTAALLTAAGMAAQDKLTWRYTTVEAATSPSAVPVIVGNELCRQVPAVHDCGGVAAVVRAGLAHGAAAAWNDARPKCPLAKIAVRQFKGRAQEFVKEWKADRSADPPRRVLDVQFLRLLGNAEIDAAKNDNDDDNNTENKNRNNNNNNNNNTDNIGEEPGDDPWALETMTPKINLCIDMLEPKTYLVPPRQGQISTKLNASVEALEQQVVDAVEDCVWKARQVGCDTVLLTVPAACVERMLDRVGAATELSKSPCSVVALTAAVDDGAAQVVDWQLHGSYTVEEIASARAVPDFPGMVDCIVPPPPDKDPASVPANQWSKFPPPEPENIPPDYPELPPFSLCLRSPVPDVKPPASRIVPPQPHSAAPPPPRGRGPPPPGRGRGRGRAPPPSGRGNRAPAPRAAANRVPPPGRAPAGRAPAAPAPWAGRGPPGRVGGRAPGRVPGRAPGGQGRVPVPAGRGGAPVAGRAGPSPGRQQNRPPPPAAARQPTPAATADAPVSPQRQPAATTAAPVSPQRQPAATTTAAEANGDGDDATPPPKLPVPPESTPEQPPLSPTRLPKQTSKKPRASVKKNKKTALK